MNKHVEKIATGAKDTASKFSYALIYWAVIVGVVILFRLVGGI